MNSKAYKELIVATVTAADACGYELETMTASVTDGDAGTSAVADMTFKERQIMEELPTTLAELNNGAK
jgi:hypothetical protein